MVILRLAYQACRVKARLEKFPNDGGCVLMTLLWAPPPDKCRCRVLWPFWLPWWRLNVSTWSDPGIDSVKDVEGSTALVAEAATPPALEIGWLQSLASDMDRLPDLKQSTTSADVYAAPTQLALSSGRLINDASLRSTTMANPSVSSIDDEHLRLRSEYKWFLMASVRPERRRAMVAHLLPKRQWARMMVSSSSVVKGRCSTRGDSWLHHRRRHDLPERPRDGLTYERPVPRTMPLHQPSQRLVLSSSLHVLVTRSISYYAWPPSKSLQLSSPCSSTEACS
ncbi:hypothetical protein OPV22_018891 [Ensete ventricosum]|uniref:Uncharacterized protein n=1 Tax=Ensete ventricosum TaxID=4639 RepID=A0AAV8QWM0_ENSVE|nr:hypothetical protein OPV22_018891 [Ensete ventricosum]